MSMFFRQNGIPRVPVYGPSRTKQAFKHDCDINRLLARAQKSGSLDHLTKYEGMYGDFEQFDFLAAQLQIRKAGEIFEALPSELRREFQQSPRLFFEFVNNPLNKDRLKDIFPALAKPGNFDLDMSMKTPPGATGDPDAPDPDAGGPPVPPATEPPPE